MQIRSRDDDSVQFKNTHSLEEERVNAATNNNVMHRSNTRFQPDYKQNKQHAIIVALHGCRSWGIIFTMELFDGIISASQ